MLSNTEQNQIVECLQKLSQNLPGFQPRTSQQQMVQAIAEAFACTPFIKDKSGEYADSIVQQGESFLVIEGPTGTGKSLAYLLPAVIMARAKNKKLLISSATVALQEQLANSDIPKLRQAGLEVTFAIAKGRGRYACPKRLYARVEGNAENEADLQIDLLAELSAEISDSEHINKSDSSSKELNYLIDQLDAGWSGDRDTLPKPVANNNWALATNDRHGCLKRNCSYFDICPFFKARQQQDKADIIIANHDLLLADIAMGGGIILPAPSETFYCLDEAHNLANKAIQQFAASHTLHGTLAWLDKLNPTIKEAISILIKNDTTWDESATNIANKMADDCKNLIESISDNLSELHRVLENTAHLKPYFLDPAPKIWRFEKSELPIGIEIIGYNIARNSLLLKTKLENLTNKLKDIIEKTRGQAKKWERTLINLGFFYGRTGNLAIVWESMIKKNQIDTPPVAKWIKASIVKPTLANKHQAIEYTLCTSPVQVSELLAKQFWRHAAGAVLTSATLRSLGKFDMLLQDTGLNIYAKTNCIALDSPFDFAKQGQLIIPNMQNDPSNPDAHTQEIINLLPQLIPTTGKNGTLMLFSSKKQMLSVAKNLPIKLKNLLLIQGEQSREKLLKEHFARIKISQPSVLFGLAAFAEGLDLPGAACNRLIIAKLPFAVPDDPVSKTLEDWLKEQNRDAFMELTLPRTSIKLIQAVGRLIRSETDQGVVIILDKRMLTKQYGRLLHRSLPAFQYEKIIL